MAAFLKNEECYIVKMRMNMDMLTGWRRVKITLDII